MPLVVGEAMAMEKLVAATDVGGVRELAGETALIVPAKDPAALARAMIEQMQRTPEEGHTLGRAARRRIEENFAMEAKADTWEGLYRSLVKEASTQTSR
jgi:glycosyltransferase involved in cell wall biosynthesis